MFSRVWKSVGVALVAVLPGLPAAAQNAKVQIDSEHSTARLIVTSSKSPDNSINVGVARVNGDVRWKAADPAKSVFDFTVYPDEKPTLDLTGSANYAVISFKSRRVEPVGYEAVRVTGSLTVTHVERIPSSDPNEGYSGPTYGPTIVHSVTREESFIFRPAKSADGAARVETNEWAAASTIVGEDFPELLRAVSAADWPAYVAEENCTMPSTACTGKTVDTLPRTEVQCAMPPPVGEDFAVEICTDTPLLVAADDTGKNGSEARNHKSDSQQPIADEVKIQLALQLAQPESTQTGTAGE